MTTPLVRPLTREVLVAGTAYRVLLTADRLTLTPKGRRKGAIEVTWDELLAWQLRDTSPPNAPEERQDWFIELLTVNEVASILRLSTRAVRRLPIRTISLGGEVRYRQSEIRAFLQKQESKVRTW